MIEASSHGKQAPASFIYYGANLLAMVIALLFTQLFSHFIRQ